jgi:isochorismate pyruvate lyase
MKSPSDCTSLQDVRDAVDAIDREIVALLGQRALYVAAAAAFKTSEGAVRAPARVEALLLARREWAQEQGLDPDFVEQLYRRIVEYFVGRELSRWSNHG